MNLNPSYSIFVELNSKLHRNAPSKLMAKQVTVLPLEQVGRDHGNKKEIATLDCVIASNEGLKHEENITQDGVRNRNQTLTSSGSIWNSWWS